MQNILCKIGVVFFMFSFSVYGQSNLKVILDNAEEGTKVVLAKMNERNQAKTIESVELKNGKVHFELPKAYPHALYILSIAEESENLFFVNENKDLQINISEDNIALSDIKGGNGNALFSAYMHKQVERNQAINKLKKQNISSKEQREKEITIQKKYTDFLMYEVRKNSSELASLYMIGELAQSQNINFQQLIKLYDNLSQEIKDTPSGGHLELQMAKIKKYYGKKMKNFTAKTPEGKKLSLEESLGQYTLVDFWAAWCGPCRQENPNLVKVYEKYHDKGFNILGVSLDRSEGSWKNAIKKDELTWPQISNLKYWQDPIAKKLQITSIPANFLLNEKGEIIAINLRGPGLAQKLAQLFD